MSRDTSARYEVRLVIGNLRLCLLRKTPLQLAEPATVRYEAEPRNEQQADLIQEAVAAIEFKGLNDGVLHLVLRTRYGKEIEEFKPDIRIDFAKQHSCVWKRESGLNNCLYHIR